jgi:hypothetical protein
VPGRAGDELLALPVLVRGIELGRVVDIFLDRDARRAVGFDVVCRDEARRFLPLAAVGPSGRELEVLSPLVLIDGAELDFYRSRTVALRELRGAAVLVDGVLAGELRDVVVAPDGKLLEVVVEADGRAVHVRYGESVTFGAARRTAA